MIGKHQTGLCEGCQEEESVVHVFLHCRKYRAQREMMRNNLREKGVQQFTLKSPGTLSFLKGYRDLFFGFVCFVFEGN